jgi:glutamine amidotransferase
VTVVKPHPLLRKVAPGAEFYFVHGYYPQPTHTAEVYATTEYERTFACALGRANYFATQFHPEKSGRVGLELLSCFATWDGQPC